MSALGFDPRPYCERLVKAGQGRFTISCTGEQTGNRVLIDDPVQGEYLWLDSRDSAEHWAFFGPLADERKIDPLALYKSYDKRKQSAFYRATRDERTKWHERDFTNELLESIIAAVVESFESEVKA